LEPRKDRTVATQQAFIAIANKKAKDADTKNHKAKAFKVDANGNCDDTDPDGSVPCGSERRRTVLTKAIHALHWQAELIDGQCATPSKTRSSIQRLQFFDNRR